MNERTVSASLTYDVVQRILGFQESRGIRHFADAVQYYIRSLEQKTVELESKIEDLELEQVVE